MASRSLHLGTGLLALAVLAGCAAPPPPPKAAESGFCRKVMKPPRDVCIAGPIPAAEAAVSAAALPASPDALTLYVIRSSYTDPTELASLQVSGQARVETLPRTFVRLSLPPGEHVVSVNWSTGRASSTVRGAAGEVKYLRLTGWAFWTTREFGFKELARTQALDLVRDAKFVADLSSPSAR